MLTRFVRIQLAIFTSVGIIGMLLMAYSYVQVPTMLGIGKITVTMELPRGGGLYRLSNVTFRGLQVGKVTAVDPTREGATATLTLDSSAKIPADLQAEVRSMSALGEQYVDLRPRTDSQPYLRDGAVIALRDTTVPQPVGPVLDRLSGLVTSIPSGKLGELLDESFQAFNGSGYDTGSLFDSASKVIGDLNRVDGQARSLIDDSVPLLDSQMESVDSIRLWARSLAGVTQQVVADDPAVRTLLQKGPGAEHEVTQLLNELKPTLPVLLANLTSLGQITLTYHASLEQVLVLLPPWTASLQSAKGTQNPSGISMGDFHITSIADPAPCTVGYLPPSQWRSPADTTTIDTPDGLYCKLPQDSPIGVRGARNFPCMGQPGKRAPTVELCNSDKPYEPLAMRQHIIGPYPMDPNLLSQGIPPDDRTTLGDNIFGPIAGTPLPPGAAPAGTPPAPEADPPAPELEQPAPTPVEPPSMPGAEPNVAPSSFSTNGSAAGPVVATVQYDPRTGKYLGPDGQTYRQSDLAGPAGGETWQDLLLPG